MGSSSNFVLSSYLPSSSPPSSNASSTSSSSSSSSLSLSSNVFDAVPELGAASASYVGVRTIGQGSFAIVKLARHRLTGREVAIKIVNKQLLAPAQLGKLQREMRIMKRVNHPNIIQLYEVLETDAALYLVMEYASGGELYDYLLVKDHLTESEARAKFMQLLSALRYCHDHRIIHRDIKPENILLDGHANIKVADFGFGNFYDPASFLDTACGSPAYAAPELFRGKAYVGPEVDLWSAGIVLYAMATGCLPFDGRSLAQIRVLVCAGAYLIPSHCSPDLQIIIRKLINIDSNTRKSVDALMDDTWLNAEGSAKARLDAICPPFSTNAAENQPIDMSIVAVIVNRYHLTEEEIINSLNEDKFDDITAIYRIKWLEKHQPQVFAHASRSSRHRLNMPKTAPVPVIAEEPPLTPKGTPISDNNIPAPTTTTTTTATIQVSQIVGASTATLYNEPKDGNKASNGSGPSSPISSSASSSSGSSVESASSTVIQILDTSESSQWTVPSQDQQFLVSSHRRSKSNSDAVVLLKAQIEAQAAAVSSTAHDDGSSGPNSRPSTAHSFGRRSASNWFSSSPPSRSRRPSMTAADVLAASASSTSPSRRPSSTAGDLLTPSSTPTHSRRPSSATTETGDARAVSPTSPTASSRPRALSFLFASHSMAPKTLAEIIAQVPVASKSVHASLTCIAPFTFIVSTDTSSIEVEICRLARLTGTHGLRLKRRHGSSSSYREVCLQFLAAMRS